MIYYAINIKEMLYITVEITVIFISYVLHILHIYICLKV
jgi:hypothetical protein